MNVKEAAKVLAYLHDCYLSANIDDSAPAVWADVFSDIDGNEVMAAAKAYARSGNKFFPSTGELFEILDANDPISSLTPGQVWSEIRSQIGAVGTNGRPILSPVVADVVSGLGGWRAVCQAEEAENLRRIPRLLDAAKRRAREQQRLNELGGGNIRRIGA